MTSTTSLLGVVAAGSRVIAIGHFTGGQSNEILFQSPTGSYFLWTDLESGTPQTVSVTLPSGYHVLDAGAYNAAAPGFSELLLQNASGNLAYGTYVSATTSFTATSMGNPGSGWSVEASADYNVFYDGNEQVLLEAVKNGIGTLQAYQSNLPAFTIPAGFTVFPNGTGYFFGADLPETLLYNGEGMVEALMEGGKVISQGVTTVVSKVSVLGILQAGQTIMAVASLNSSGATDILLQNGGTLSEWVVQDGVVKQTLTLGTLPSGSTVSGFANLNDDGASDILLTLNSGEVEVVAGSPTAPSAAANAGSTRISGTSVSTAPLNKSKPAVIVDSNYFVVTAAGVNATLSDYLAQLTSGALAATGATVLTIQQGALSNCSYEQVAAGNITFAAWQQNVVTLNAIAQACLSQGIAVQVETSLGEGSNFGPSGTEQWLMPAITAGLPIAYVEDDQELANWQNMNVNTMAASMLQNMAIIQAALPNVAFGEWQMLGDVTNNGSISAYEAFLNKWWLTLNGSAAALGLSGISFVIADQYYSPELVAGTTAVSAAGQDPSQNMTYNQFADFAQNAEADGIAVEIQAAASDVDLSPLQVLARQELEVSQEATLGIAGIQLSASFNPQPDSAAVNVSGSTYNGAAEIAAIEPLYQAGVITTAGSIALKFASQVVLLQGGTVALEGLSVVAGGADQSKRLAVVLIDQTGTLSATQKGGATVSRNGANILILDGTPADVAAELATVTLNEAVSGPDSIDVEVFGSTGRIVGGSINALATNANGVTNFTANAAGASPQTWQSASAQVNNGMIVSETFVWNGNDGLSSAGFTGGTTIAPVMQIAVDQPLLEQGLISAGTIANLPSSIVDWHTVWQTYDPLDPVSGSTSETVPMTVTASTRLFDPSTGSLQYEVDTLAALPQSSVSTLFPFSSSVEAYYFANGGSVVTTFNTGDNSNWSSSLYANGAGGIFEISGGPTLVIADGSTTPMIVGSVQTIYGNVNGVQRVVEVRYLGGAADPYDEVEQIFNPYSATPQLWQQVQTVAIPSSMAGNSPLEVPSATTEIEFNTGNNPDFPDAIWTDINGSLVAQAAANQLEVATTFENGNWDSQAQISAAGVATVQRGVTWIGEGEILNAYTLATPVVTGWTAPHVGATATSSSSSWSISGSGLAGDWVVVTGSDGQTLGGAEIDANGTWTITPYAGFTPQISYAATAQQFDLAGDASVLSAAFNINTLFVRDTAIDVAADLNELEARTISGDLTSITLTDSGTPILTVSAEQITADAAALACIKTPYILDPSAAEAAAAATFPNVVAVAVEDTVANVAANLNALETLATNDKLTLITLTDRSVPTLVLSAAQWTEDAAALALIKSPYNQCVAMSGVSSQYIVANDGGSLYIQDTVTGRDGTQILPGINEAVFTNGTALLDPTGSAEDIARLYEGLLDRQPETAGLQYWTSQADGSHVSLTAIANAFAQSPEFIHDYGSLSDAAFINQLYENVLSRPADASGAQYWGNVVASGVSRGSVAFDFAECPESQADSLSTSGDNNNGEIYRLYEAAFARSPDPGGQSYWSSVLAGGTTAGQVAQAFCGSAEFQAHYGAMSISDFVTAMYQNVLHRAPDQGGLQYWTATMQGGSSQANVLVAFADSLESRVMTAGATHANWVFIPS